MKTIALLLLLPSLALADAESEARIRVALALARQKPQAEAIDPYSAFVEELRQQPQGTRATFTATVPIGQLRAGSTWRMWFTEAGELVGENVSDEPKRKTADWVDDAYHRHDPLPGDHRHQCPMGHVWFHNGSNSFGDRWAHTCPVPGCGMQDWNPKQMKSAAPVRRTATSCPI